MVLLCILDCTNAVGGYGGHAFVRPATVSLSCSRVCVIYNASSELPFGKSVNGYYIALVFILARLLVPAKGMSRGDGGCLYTERVSADGRYSSEQGSGVNACTLFNDLVDDDGLHPPLHFPACSRG